MSISASNLFSTLGGIYGASWGTGWELGKAYGPSYWYGDNDNKWFEKLSKNDRNKLHITQMLEDVELHLRQLFRWKDFKNISQYSRIL